MARLIATSISRQGRDILLSTDQSEYTIGLFLRELEHFDQIEVKATPHKQNRSTRQNNMLWALIRKISDEINASHREEDIMHVYCDLLVKGNVEYVIVAVEPRARHLLEKQFRVVQELQGSVTTERGVLMQGYKCFIGSSKYNTKQMGELIELALDMAHEIGIKDSVIESIREEYNL